MLIAVVRFFDCGPVQLGAVEAQDERINTAAASAAMLVRGFFGVIRFTGILLTVRFLLFQRTAIGLLDASGRRAGDQRLAFLIAKQN